MWTKYGGHEYQHTVLQGSTCLLPAFSRVKSDAVFVFSCIARLRKVLAFFREGRKEYDEADTDTDTDTLAVTLHCHGSR